MLNCFGYLYLMRGRYSLTFMKNYVVRYLPILNERSVFSPFMVNYVVGFLYSMINYADGYLDLMSGRYYLLLLVHST